MSFKEIAILGGLALSGFLLLGITIGFSSALYLGALILGVLLMYMAFEFAMMYVSHEVTETLEESMAERQGKNFVNTAYSARNYKEQLDNEEQYGKVVHDF